VFDFPETKEGYAFGMAADKNLLQFGIYRKILFLSY